MRAPSIVLLRQTTRHFFRLTTHLQMMPVLESGDEPLIGGQAVIEGVMMRTPRSYCVTVRRPDGKIVQQTGRVKHLTTRYRVFDWPVLRGLITLGQALVLGVRTLRFSANQALVERSTRAGADIAESTGVTESERGVSKCPYEISNWAMGLNVGFSLLFFIFLYKFLPLTITTQLQNYVSWFDSSLGFTLIDGILRLTVFLTFIALVSRMEDIQRVFEYHGAEHKVVFNHESNLPLSVKNSQSFCTFHPRCGTSFFMVVMLMSPVVYALIPVEGLALKLLIRVIMLPIIAGMSYEIIRLAARRQGILWMWIVAPGLWLQRITTQNPNNDQVRISIQSLKTAMALEREQNGEPVIA
jgi:uncharacterized protein YqhQ